MNNHGLCFILFLGGIYGTKEDLPIFKQRKNHRIMKYTFLFILSCIILLGCGETIDQASEFPAIWHLSSSKSKNQTHKSKDALMNESEAHEAGQKGMFLCIFPDQQFTQLDEEGYYDYGTWSWINEGERVRLDGKKGSVEWDIKIKLQSDEQAELSTENKNELRVWQRQATMLKKFKEDEFYPSNNEWRIKPDHLESQAQLIKRLGSYFKHTTYLLKAADIRDVDVVSFKHSDGAVKIYNSGIGVKDWEYISDLWKNSFYNHEQAKRARLLFLNYLTNYPYNGTGSSDWVKDDYFLMLHIYNDLNEGKFNEPISNELLDENL